MELVNLKELSRRAGTKESNLRRYVDNFPTHFPHQMAGRLKLYPDSLIPLIQLIMKRYQSKTPTDIIKMELERDYPQIIDVEEVQFPHATTAETGLSVEVFGQMMQMVVEKLDQSKEIGALRSEVEWLKQEHNKRVDEELRRKSEKKGLIRKLKEIFFGRD